MAPGRVVVVGGGISGLVAAYRLLQTSNGTPLDITVVEAAHTLGGKLRTGTLAGIPIEEGADSFVIRKPWAIDLCRELGLGDQLVAPVQGGALVWARGRLVPYPKLAAFGIPSSVEDLLRWPGLSRKGRWRAAADLLRPPRKERGDESLLSLATRRMGPEAARVLIGPLLAGIHAGDPANLGVRATFPELVTWEQGHGSLIRGSKAAVRAARDRDGRVGGPLFATVWAGLSSLIGVLADALGPNRIRTGEPVTSIERSSRGWLVRSGSDEFPSDAVVLATPAFESARLVRPHSAPAAADLAAIPHASTAVVSMVFGDGTAALLPPGTGFIVPPSDGDGPPPRTITACTWISSKWPREEHDRRAVLRCFVGRQGEESALELPDDELVRAVARDVAATTPLRDRAEAWRVSRWPRSMPQYEVGHLDRLTRIDSALVVLPGLFLTGSAYRGVGIPDCVHQAGQTAERVRSFLAGHEGAGPGGPSAVEQEVNT